MSVFVVASNLLDMSFYNIITIVNFKPKNYVVEGSE